MKKTGTQSNQPSEHLVATPKVRATGSDQRSNSSVILRRARAAPRRAFLAVSLLKSASPGRRCSADGKR